ncbi:transglutaminase domain-containing protein [Gloeomargarita lithophora Alchichica-D10]|uniref:Transglutaminase domain-containing protein n=1 Tax=Gloeomargarita lithophora Alchichica-D10 TaxID=1188229 RepID=A0A1J0ABZ5_9CYAN|nr:transglutaminase family protein [Gloeomargarita lithophora]APB33439.1 transglutaminase domain-containing protein [Gloeomargarita lithophora Alchichica-D10]
MSVIYDLEHQTTYRYRRAVTFGQHQGIFLPSVSAYGRVLGYTIATNLPCQVRWKMDTLSNNVALLDFSEPGDELRVTFRLRGEHFGIPAIGDFPLLTRAEEVPVQYTPDEWIDLVVFMRPHAEDQDGHLAAWAKEFVAGDQDMTLDVLQRMMDAIGQFTYQARETEGTQAPEDTLRLRSGTCRDYAWLMIEALRRLGLACRFVTGYLYDPALDQGGTGMVGSGTTHAWLQVYLPGAGWRAYDPTNRITAGTDLIRVGIGRHPGQVLPLSGSWFGESGDYLGMDVRVSLKKVLEIPEPA